jgi:hypothetical protein
VDLSSGGEGPEREADHSPPSSAAGLMRRSDIQYPVLLLNQEVHMNVACNISSCSQMRLC